MKVIDWFSHPRTHPGSRRNVVDMLAQRQQNARSVILCSIGQEMMASLHELGFVTFEAAGRNPPARTTKAMLAKLKQGVIKKWTWQHHVMELSDGENDYGFIGTPEW